MNTEEQMVKGEHMKDPNERNLGKRIEDKESEEQTRLRVRLRERWAEMSRLLAEQRTLTVKLSESFVNLREELKKHTITEEG